MKKVSMWLVGIMTSLVSLAAMLLFDFVLSVIYYFIAKVPYLSDITGFIGDILDLGLTIIVAMSISVFIWRIGHTLTEKIKGEDIKYKDGPVSYINSLFILVFFAALIFFGFKFAMLVGAAVASYTADIQGFAKFLMFFEAVKDTLSFVCNEYILLYKIGTNSFILSIMNIYADGFIDKK